MPVPTAEKLEFYYPLKLNAADGLVSPLRTVSAATIDTIDCVALVQADNYWNGAIGRFESNTTTAALRGIWFHIEDFTAATDRLQLAKELPVVPVNTDTFRLFLGGNWRTSHEILGLTASAPVSITGVDIEMVAYWNGTGNSELQYDASETSLAYTAPGDGHQGAWVDVSGGGTFTLFSEDTDKWIRVDVNAGALPGGDQTDTIALTQPHGVLLPDAEGYEIDGGKTRYHLVVVRNSDASDIMVALRAWVLPYEDATDTTAAGAVAIAGTYVDLTNPSGWPVRSFWIYNVTKNDCRFVYYRSGARLYISLPGAGLRGLVAQAWDSGDTVSVMPELDIGLDAPAVGQFENPATEETAPAGVTFSAPETYAGGLQIGDLAALGLYGIWIREVIIDDAHPRGMIENPIRFRWR